MQKGLFVALEGNDGAGKTTAAQALLKRLKKEGFDVVLSREPGGPAISEQIRSILLDPANKAMNPKTEALLYAASRTQHFYEVIQPALNEGKIVLCDRFLDSSIAYQGYGRNLGQNAIEEINDFGLNHQRPDLTLFFKVPLSVSQKRMEKRGNLDRLDAESLGFHQRVREGFDVLSTAHPEKTIIIDAQKSPEEVADQAYQAILDFISK